VERRDYVFTTPRATARRLERDASDRGGPEGGRLAADGASMTHGTHAHASPSRRAKSSPSCSRIIGHASITPSANLYGNLTDAMLGKATERTDTILGRRASSA
jgi:hypothetical protein